MKIQTVNALIGSRQKPEHEDYKLQVYRCGLDAVPVTEIPIYQAMNGLDSVTMVSPAGEYETGKQDEFDRLQAKFPKSVHLAYPSAAAPMPKAIEDLDLTPDQIDRRPKREVPVDVPGPVARGQTVATETPPDGSKAALRARLAELGVNVGFGNYSVARLQAMIDEAEKTKAA